MSFYRKCFEDKIEDRWPLIIIKHLVTMYKTQFLLSLKCRRERTCVRMEPCSYMRIDVGNTCLIFRRLATVA